jgi:hypothetical protein
MALLDNTYLTIDAVLTKKGRELLARNDGSFQITQFAWRMMRLIILCIILLTPSGSAFYGEAIERMPLIEAFPDEAQIMRYKLVTLPRGTSKLPVVSLGYTSIILKQGASISIQPQTLNYLGATSTFEANGYAMTVADIRLLSVFSGTGINVSQAPQVNQTTGTKLSKSEIGTSFTLTGTTIDTLFGSTLTQLSTTLTVIGRDSGARITVPLIIKKSS